MKLKRTKLLKVRLTGDEMNQLSGPVNLTGKAERNVSRFVRAKLFGKRGEMHHPIDCKHCRLLAMAVNNLNVIARRALDSVRPDTGIEVIAQLAALEREIRRAAGTLSEQ